VKDENKFAQRRSIRMASYDYSGPGTYFITLCVKDKACLLGDTKNDAMSLSALGIVAQSAWAAIPAHFPAATLDEFVVMPNHLHGILRLQAGEIRTQSPDDFSRPASGSLAAVIRSFKSFSTRAINQLRRTPGGVFWQRNYYERIIRDEDELMRIRSYIRLNPEKWQEDEYHSAFSGDEY
jgi:REP element-mobilizing transposase RayT